MAPPRTQTPAPEERQINELLGQFGYQVFYNATADRYGCVDFIARRGDSLLLIKYSRDIDRFKSRQIEELKYLAHVLQGIPLIVGSRNRRGDLEDEVVYYRNGISTLTLDSFRQYLTKASTFSVFAKRGGFFVHLDGHQLRALRESKNISRSTLADKLDVSKRTIENYERNAMNPAREKYEQLREMFASDFALFIDPLDWVEDVTVPKGNAVTGFQKTIGELLEDLGLVPFWSQHSPFDLFIAREDGDQEEVEPAVSTARPVIPLVSDVSGGQEEEDVVRKRVDTIARFHQIVQKRVMFIVEEEIPHIRRLSHEIPVLKAKDFAMLNDLKDLVKMILRLGG